MLETMLLAIDFDTVVQIVVFLFIIFSTLAGHFFKPKPKPKPQREKKPTPRPRAPERVDEPVTAQLERQRLEDEIDAMLRKATAQPPEPKAPEPIVEATVVPVEPIVEPRESVAEHVSKHISSEGIGSLRTSVDRADERLETRLHQKFDHLLGRLDSSQPKSTAASSVGEGTDAAVWQNRQRSTHGLARQVMQMIRDPASISAAIVLTEVLRRPDDRWD